MSMWEYLSKIKTPYDLLEAAGYAVTDTEQISSILGGLEDEYEATVAMISSK